jgi:transposase
MAYHRGPSRQEIELLPACLEDYVGESSAVRVIDAFVEGLNLSTLGLARTEPAKTGRPPYHPADLLKLYLYGYLFWIRSSRRLEAEAQRNLEVMWLLRRVRPDYKTIADFRKDNRGVFKTVFRQFNLLCRRLELFGAELVAIDGSKFKAVNGLGRHFTQEKVQELLGQVETRIEEYLQTLDQKETEAEGAPGTAIAIDPESAAQLAEKLAELKKLQERQERYTEWLGVMAASGVPEIALTDPDSRKMKGPHGDHYVGYNVQVAVDEKHHLIAAEDVVTEANDCHQLHPMAAAARAELAAPNLQATADAGYHHVDHLAACEQAGLVTFVPGLERPRDHGKDGQPIFGAEDFCYEAEADRYRCPAGRWLPRRGDNVSRGRTAHLYYARAACADCPLKARCTTASHRVLRRLPHQDVVDRAAARAAAHPEFLARRKEIVEHVFGTLRWWGHDNFLLRGLAKVRAEFSLSALAYNLRRALNVLGVPHLLRALAAA